MRRLVLCLSFCVLACSFANDGFSAHEDHATIENVSFEQPVIAVDSSSIEGDVYTLKGVDMLHSVHLIELNFISDEFTIVDNYSSISLRKTHVQKTRAGPFKCL